MPLLLQKKNIKVLPKASYISLGVLLAMSKPKPRCFGCNGQGVSGKEKLTVKQNISKYHIFYLTSFHFQLKMTQYI